MINICFVNLILIMANNASDSGKPGSPCPSAPITSSSYLCSALIGSSCPRSSASIVPGSSCYSASVRSCSLRFSFSAKFIYPSNFIPDFFADVLANPFGNLSVDASSNLAITSAPSSVMPSLFDLPIFGRFF